MFYCAYHASVGLGFIYYLMINLWQGSYNNHRVQKYNIHTASASRSPKPPFSSVGRNGSREYFMKMTSGAMLYK